MQWKTGKGAGIGISQAMQQLVFYRFLQVRETQVQNFQGPGLGLFISAGIIYRYGGKTGVKSRIG